MGYRYDLKSKIDFAVFPGLQGGPHNHTIAALATALKQTKEPAYVDYQKQVRIIPHANAMQCCCCCCLLSSH
jgi:glycine/serine hydroxymethyltransferase